MGSSGERWRGTVISGWSESGQKCKTWDLIRGLGNVPGLPWILAGEFNEVLYEPEKRGGNGCDLSSIQGFRDVVAACELKDMGCTGYRYTWSNNRGTIL